MLGWNQRPSPCKLGQGFPGGYSPAGRCRKVKQFLTFLALVLSYSVRVCSSQDASWLHRLTLFRPAPFPPTLSRLVAYCGSWYFCLPKSGGNARGSECVFVAFALAFALLFYPSSRVSSRASRVVAPRRISMDLWYSSAVISPRAKRSLRISSAESRGASSRSSLRTLGEMRTTNHVTTATSPPKNRMSSRTSGSQRLSSGSWPRCSRRAVNTPICLGMSVIPCILAHRSLLAGLASTHIVGSTRRAARLPRRLHA